MKSNCLNIIINELIIILITHSKDKRTRIDSLNLNGPLDCLICAQKSLDRVELDCNLLTLAQKLNQPTN